MKKPQIIAIAEIKGGTGKTSTAAALAQAAIIEGKKVLCIDLDPQGNLTLLLGADPQRPGAPEILNGNPAAEVIQETSFDIDIISGRPDLYIEQPESGSASRLRDALEPIQSNYDLIIIDTPPSLGEMTFNALQACTGLLAVLDADGSALQGLYMITDIAEAAKQTNTKLKVLGCIVAKYNPRTNLERRLRDNIEAKAKKSRCKYLGEIRQGVAIREAQAYRKNLFKYAPKSKPAEDYKALYTMIIK